VSAIRGTETKLLGLDICCDTVHYVTHAKRRFVIAEVTALTGTMPPRIM